jgi:hypothetical protein
MKLIAAQMIKQFSVLNGSRRISIMFTNPDSALNKLDRHCILAQFLKDPF